MNRVEVRAQARELLDVVYMTAAEESGRTPGAARLAELARAARDDGAPLDQHGEGPWRSDRCRFAHPGPGAGATASSVTCVMRGEFELPLPEHAAADVAALLNWAEVPEPGAQT